MSFPLTSTPALVRLASVTATAVLLFGCGTDAATTDADAGGPTGAPVAAAAPLDAAAPTGPVPGIATSADKGSHGTPDPVGPVEELATPADKGSHRTPGPVGPVEELATPADKGSHP